MKSLAFFRRHVIRLAFPIGLMALMSVGCSPSSATERVTKAEVLANVPVNRDQRCVGIAIVLEALLDAETLKVATSHDAASIADLLYERATAGGKVQLSQYVRHDGERILLVSREGLELLSTLIADRYKQAFKEAEALPTKEWRLKQAMRNLQSSRALEEVLAADPDHAVVFCGLGERKFPDGKVRETNHAFVLQRDAAGKLVVYDPNDPQRPAACKVSELAEGVIVTWTSRYRDTGLVTTQYYYLQTAKSALQETFASDP